jgi:hypothetical protein
MLARNGSGAAHHIDDAGARGFEQLGGRLEPLATLKRQIAQDLRAEPIARQYALHYGSDRTPSVIVAPDDFWPGMYRLIWPTGRQSDMTNLSRAKDAALAICERGPPRRDQRLLHWEIYPREKAPEARPCVKNGCTLPDTFEPIGEAAGRLLKKISPHRAKQTGRRAA